MKLKLTRIEHDNKEVIGILTIHDDSGKLLMVASTLEPIYGNNPKIALGKHELIKYFSPHWQTNLWKFNNPNERDRYFEIHIGNYVKDSDGCLLIGNGFANINSDREIDIINSKGTFKRFKVLLEKYNKLEIEIVEV